MIHLSLKSRLTVTTEGATRYGENRRNLKTWIRNGLLILRVFRWFSNHYDSIREFFLSILKLVLE